MDVNQILEKKYLSYYSSVICVALLALYIHWIPPFMVAWVVFWFAENRNEIFRKDVFWKKSTILFLLFVLLYFWQVAGLLYSDNFSSGFERLYKRIGFILFPLVLFFPGSKIKLNIIVLFKVFIISILIYLLYCYVNAFFNSISIINGELIFNAYDEYYTYESFFEGARLSAIVHPTYLSMYVLLSLILSLEITFGAETKRTKRSIWILISIFLLVSVYLLSSRAGILSAMIIVPFFVLKKLYTKVSKSKLIIVLLFLSLFTGFLIVTNDRLKYSFEEIANGSVKTVLDKNSRILIWKSAVSVISKNPILGVGTGDASKELKNEFIFRGYREGFYDNMNSHNQFLEIFLENGLIGLIMFIVILIYIGYIAVSEKNMILALYLLMVLIFFVFETVLNRLAGLTFFSIFTFLLIHYSSNVVEKISPK